MPTLLRFLIAAVAIVAFTACGDEGASAPAAAPTGTAEPTATPIPTPEPTATPLPTPTPSTATTAEKGGSTGADPRAVEVLVAAAKAVQEAGTLHFVVDARIKIPSEGRVTTIPVTYEGDAQVPDSLKGTLTVSLGFFSLTMETVHVDGKTYTTNIQSGEWEVSAGLTAAIPSPVEILQVALPALAETSLVGEEEFQGIGVHRLHGLVPEEILSSSEGKAAADFLIGLEDSLIYEITAEGQVPLDEVDVQLPGVDMKGNADIELTITFSAYGEPVDIQAPQLP